MKPKEHGTLFEISIYGLQALQTPPPVYAPDISTPFVHFDITLSAVLLGRLLQLSLTNQYNWIMYLIELRTGNTAEIYS